MSFEQLVVVADADLGLLEPEAVATGQPWGDSSWPDQIRQGKRVLKTWVDSDYAELGVGMSDRIRDRYEPDTVWTFIGGAYVDVTTEAANADEEDIDLAATFATPATDALYLGSPWMPTGLYVGLLDSVNAAASVLTVSYWGHGQWTAVPSQSDTTDSGGATLAQSGQVNWAPVPDAERRSINGSTETLYWLRLQVDATLTAGTSASQILPRRTPDGLRMVASYLSLSQVMLGLAAQSSEPEEWRTRATDYMERAETLYSRLKASGGIPLDLDRSGAVSSSEQHPSAALSIGRMPRA